MFRTSWIFVRLLATIAARPCAAQDSPSNRRQNEPARAIAPRETAGTVIHTPEMWFYEQERSRHDDPKMAVRRKAELKAAQRADRLAAMAWYGQDNLRPTISATPMMTSYGPYWGSNTYDPNRWRPYAPIVVSRAPGERY